MGGGGGEGDCAPVCGALHHQVTSITTIFTTTSIATFPSTSTSREEVDAAVAAIRRAVDGL